MGISISALSGVCGIRGDGIRGDGAHVCILPGITASGTKKHLLCSSLGNFSVFQITRVQALSAESAELTLFSEVHLSFLENTADICACDVFLVGSVGLCGDRSYWDV